MANPADMAFRHHAMALALAVMLSPTGRVARLSERRMMWTNFSGLYPESAAMVS
ncbi:MULTISPECIES: hypothetical protein [Bosea]|jgi:hypothetical protein|uniref:hypothetical protein n=1 Tax=Bosea TaxID=85413 RepID=UPI00215007C6|nr:MULTISPECIES: hypothetical protein [Bosea]MCR4524070.1 hypothetical protein [Bosea sp. 47.2.35]MDR6827445.1 hypothetical protein [Bosea robiniae]MDR6894155.1 hypothetical protein [Bosea sp. BE109]MDR7137550.1 hypothetical protein [Bosea sp. BE168]MDR7174250.1 hypothetical protein [Bosea sp. BE271]